MAGHNRTILCSGAQHTLPNRLVGESGFKGGCRCHGCIDGHYEHARLYRNRPEVKVRRSSHNRRWRIEHEKEWLADYRSPTSAYRHRVRKQQRLYSAWLADLKLASGCVDCGYVAEAAALEFDHVRGEKLFVLCRGQGHSHESLLAEIAKCDIVCSNCHHIRTHTRRWGALNKTYRPLTEQERMTVPNGVRPYCDWLAAIKMNVGCIDCGYAEHPAALEFDHVRGDKIVNLSRACGRRPELILAEIAKCDVVCSNCHHVRSYNRRLLTRLAVA